MRVIFKGRNLIKNILNIDLENERGSVLTIQRRKCFYREQEIVLNSKKIKLFLFLKYIVVKIQLNPALREFAKLIKKLINGCMINRFCP